jgi:hypothetical protein
MAQNTANVTTTTYKPFPAPSDSAGTGSTRKSPFHISAAETYCALPTFYRWASPTSTSLMHSLLHTVPWQSLGTRLGCPALSCCSSMPSSILVQSCRTWGLQTVYTIQMFIQGAEDKHNVVTGCRQSREGTSCQNALPGASGSRPAGPAGRVEVLNGKRET